MKSYNNDRLDENDNADSFDVSDFDDFSKALDNTVSQPATSTGTGEQQRKGPAEKYLY